MEYNVKYYRWFYAFSSGMAWLPIFFLYFSESLNLKEILILESIYYFSVVLLEFPSGYFSDVFGRKITLCISTVLFCIAYFLFGIGSDFLVFSIAQILLAGAISFQSGTATSFLYESLVALEKSEMYGAMEAKVQQLSQIISGFAVLLGGILGSIHLSYGYWLSLIFMIPPLFLIFGFTEPNSHESEENFSIISQLGSIFNYLKNTNLAWVFGYSILLYGLTHIPYEFYQGYLKVLENRNQFIIVDAAMTSGILFALTRFIGAYSASQSMIWKEKLGLVKLLALAILIQLLIIGIMGSVVHSLIILIVLLRNFSYSMSIAPIREFIAPLIHSRQRASYLSIQSLFSRLGFAGILFVFSMGVGGEASDSWDTLSWIFRNSFLGGAVLCVLLFLIRPKNIQATP